MKRLGKQLHSHFSIIGALSLAFILGCGASYTTPRPVLDQKTLVKPDSGIVVARVINASSYPLPFNNLTITPENLNTSKKIKPNELQALHPLRKDTSVFASSVPIGNYSLHHINAWYIRGEYRYSFFIPSSTKFGTFEVKPGHVTDLGTLVYYPKPQTDNYLKIISRIPDTANGEVLKNHFPFYQYDPNKVISWKEDGLTEDRESMFVSIAQNPLIYDETYLAPDGSVHFLSRLGIILTRTSEGEWLIDGVDTNLKLNAIAQNTNGDMVVGGAEGKLFLKLRDQDWQDISIGFNKEILSLSFKTPSTIDMITNETKRAAIYRANIDSLEWKEMNAFSAKSGWTNFDSPETNNPDQATKGGTKVKSGKSYRIFSINTHEIEGEHIIEVSTVRSSHSGVFASATDKSFSYNPETWEVSANQSNSEMDLIVQSGNVQVGIEKAGYWDWDGLPEYFRYDQSSEQWIEFKSQVYFCPGDVFSTSKSCPGKEGSKKKIKAKRRQFKFYSLPLFSSEFDAIALVSFPKFGYANNGASKKMLLKTEDGGKTWSDTGNSLPREYCTQIIRQVTDRILLSCEGASTDFFESFDNGASWEHVRQQEDF